MKTKILFLGGLLLTVITQCGCGHHAGDDSTPASTNAAAPPPALTNVNTSAISNGANPNGQGVTNWSDTNSAATTNQ